MKRFTNEQDPKMAPRVAPSLLQGRTIRHGIEPAFPQAAPPTTCPQRILVTETPAAIQQDPSATEADVIVVGAGPAGSATAYHLAQAGLDVLLLEKTVFPREKVCGDGLTPRATKQLIKMGVDLDAPGWIRNKGLRIIGGGVRLELPWPDLASYPDYGLVRTRMDFDQILAERAVAAGAKLRHEHRGDRADRGRHTAASPA